MTLRSLCNAVNIECGAEDVEIKSIKSNSKKVENGDLFICVKGLNNDGHDYVDEAIERGAAAVISEHDIECSVPHFKVNDTRKILPCLCDAQYGFPSKKLKLVAVTGTNGKTTVTHILRAIFDAAMYKTGLIGTVRCYSGNRIIESDNGNPLANMTTPDPEELFKLISIMAEEGVQYLFMEASSHALALDKLEGLEFEAAVFTNLTPEHLDFHKDMEEYFSAKSKLFHRSKRCIINTDDVYGKRLMEKFRNRAVGCSVIRKCCDYLACDIKEPNIFGNQYRLVADARQFIVRTPLVGSFNVMNTLEAAACAAELGVSAQIIMSALSSMNGVSGRLERVKLGIICDYSVFIDYAHTPDALYNLLDTLCRIRRCDGRIVLVFGCGGDRDKSKRAKMGEIAARYADKIVLTADNSRSEKTSDIIAEIEKGVGCAEYTVIEDRAKAIEYAVKNAQSGDVIVLAGKGHEEYEIDADGKHPFCERDIAVAAAQKYCR